jgi:hypothetical protein
MMRTKLGLTDTELMNMPWIALMIATNDFPWYDYKKGESKKTIKVSDPSEIAEIFKRNKK